MARVDIAVQVPRPNGSIRFFQFSTSFGAVTVIPSRPTQPGSGEPNQNPVTTPDPLIGFDTSKETAA